MWRFKILLLIIFVYSIFPAISTSADYILKKDSFIFSSAFQIAHLENLKGDAFDGYIVDQIRSGKIVPCKEDSPVIIVDECTFCRYLPAFKVTSPDRKGAGWVLKDQLKIVNKKKSARKY